MIIALDFDGVLFNDEKFKKEYQKIFRRFGISDAVYERAYKESKQKSGGYYEPKYQFQIFKKQNPDLRVSDLWNAVADLVKTAPSYVYADAEPFLSFFKKNRTSLFVLSTGDFGYHRKKVRASGLGAYFKKVHVVRNISKAGGMRRIIRSAKNESVIFLDDKKEVADEIKKAFPRVFVIQVTRRKDQILSKEADMPVKNLNEAKNSLSKIHGLS